MPTGPRPTPPNRSVRAAISGGYGGAEWTNVMWLYLTGSGEITSATLHTLANDVYSAYQTNFGVHLSYQWTIDQVQLVLFNDPDEIVAYSTLTSVVGEVVGIGFPANVAACISWPIAPHYRGGHPRTYICGIPGSAGGNPTTWDDDFRSSLASAANDFHTDLEGITGGSGIASVEHGVVSFQSGGEWRDPPVFRRILDGASVDSRIDTQRRRLGRDR